MNRPAASGRAGACPSPPSDRRGAPVVNGRRIDAFLRAASAAGEHRRVGPFLARFAIGNDHPMLNYAVPDDDAAPSTGEVGALVELFEGRRLRPRLEYAAAAAPALEAILLGCGFELERRLPVMACVPSVVPPPAIPDGLSVAVATSGRDHAAAIAAANEAYGEPPRQPTPEEITARRKLTASGGAVVLARDAESGEPAGSGVLTAPMAGVSELAGVGTRPAHRNRGVAAAVVARLLERAAGNGIDLVWLSPEDERAERIYARTGFALVGVEMIHISRPPSGNRAAPAFPLI